MTGTIISIQSTSTSTNTSYRTWLCHRSESSVRRNTSALQILKYSSICFLLVIREFQGFEEKRKVMKTAFTAQLAVIVVPNTDKDVSTIIATAKNNNLEVIPAGLLLQYVYNCCEQLSVRSWGHSYTCTNIKEGGLHVDMRSPFLGLVDTYYNRIVQVLQQDGDGRRRCQPYW